MQAKASVDPSKERVPICLDADSEHGCALIRYVTSIKGPISRMGDQRCANQAKGWHLASAYGLLKPQQEEKLRSLVEHQYKCFLRLPKKASQVRMSKSDEEKTCFHMEEGVYCFTHMLKGIKILKLPSKGRNKSQSKEDESHTLRHYTKRSGAEKAVLELIHTTRRLGKILRGYRVNVVTADPMEGMLKDDMDYEALLAGLVSYSPPLDEVPDYVPSQSSEPKGRSINGAGIHPARIPEPISISRCQDTTFGRSSRHAPEENKKPVKESSIMKIESYLGRS
nr:hypothetical protein [Tanacetum cinerariifolium]